MEFLLRFMKLIRVFRFVLFISLVGRVIPVICMWRCLRPAPCDCVRSYVHVFFGLPKIIPWKNAVCAIAPFFMCYHEASLEFFNKFRCQVRNQIVLDSLSITVNI